MLTALPGAAAALVLARRGLRSVPLLLIVFLVATGMVAMLAFWLYFAAPAIGKAFSVLVVAGSAGLTAWFALGARDRHGPPAAAGDAGGALGARHLLHRLPRLPAAGEADPLGTAANRFVAAMPTDNGIPLFYAEWFYHHGHASPVPEFPATWLSSDRPPLQVGYVLSQTPFYSSGSTLAAQHYEAIGVALQQLWIIALRALLDAARIGRITEGLAMITVLVSDLAIVNGFFVWPQMLPAAMLVAIAALVLTPFWEEVRSRTWGAVLVAALAGIAMMGHGGSVFALIPLPLVAAWRGLPSWRWLGVLVGLCFVAPWSAYQRYADPPGNRPLKYMLAGEAEVCAKGSGQAINRRLPTGRRRRRDPREGRELHHHVRWRPRLQSPAPRPGRRRRRELVERPRRGPQRLVLRPLSLAGLLLIVMALARSRGRCGRPSGSSRSRSWRRWRSAPSSGAC